VHLALAARRALLPMGVEARVVSFPSWELFEAQAPSYRRHALPPAVGARLAIEAGVAQGWRRYVGDGGDVLALSPWAGGGGREEES